MQVDNPQIVPTTLEQDLLGDQPPIESSVPATVRAHDDFDLSELPPPSTTGIQSIVHSDSDDDVGGLFGDDEEDEVPKTPEILDDDKIDPSQQVADFEREDKKEFADYLGVGEDGITDEERARRKALEYEEDDVRLGDEGEYPSLDKQESIAQLALAPFPIPATDKVWHARLPNFLSLASTAFDELLWDPEDDKTANQREGTR